MVHRYNPSILVEYITSCLNDCIQAPFVTGCSMIMSQSDGMCLNCNDVNAMKNLPEINNAMSFLTKNNFTTGLNNSPGNNANWVSQCLIISVRGETINNGKTVMKDVMQYLVIYHLIRKTTKYSTVQRVNGMILFP